MTKGVREGVGMEVMASGLSVGLANVCTAPLDMIKVRMQTAKVGNGMFKKYTRENKKPNGNYSDIYIIVNNKFFSGESDEMYQIHFETNQLRDRSNGPDKNIYEPVLSESEGLTNFFYEELIEFASSFK